MELMKLDFTSEQVALIKSQIAPNATEDELKLFLYQCKRTGLDPLARQIYAIWRKVRNNDGSYSMKMTIQVSIDGFRVIAERTGQYAGQDEPVFDYDANGNLKSCKVTVYKFNNAGQRYSSATGIAHWAEYVQEYNGKASGLWGKMPHVMISKVAESVALRKSFPQDLSGLYTTEEMPEVETEKKEMPVTTLYNHKSLGTEEKPLISNLSFKIACEMAENDPTIYDKTLNKYTLTTHQDSLLRSMYKKQNDNGIVIIKK